MNTEDDTFRILARPDIHKMIELHRTWREQQARPFNSMLNISFMKYHGWVWTEFLRARKVAGYTY